jgi:hypothetical protein
MRPFGKTEQIDKMTTTLGPKMFGVGGFWLEIRVIIKISTQLATQEPLTNFHGDEAIFFFKFKMADSKKHSF